MNQVTSEEMISQQEKNSNGFSRDLAPELRPQEVVEYLDRFIVAQNDAKRSVALALRSRWRRLQVENPLRQEITPKNILMIGPTGVGKTEIARRLARLTKAPFVKVEASKFTEVGYIGRDVESIIRDLVDSAHAMVREEYRNSMVDAAKKAVEDQLLKLLLKTRSSDMTKSEEDSSEESEKGDVVIDEQILSHAKNEISKAISQDIDEINFKQNVNSAQDNGSAVHKDEVSKESVLSDEEKEKIKSDFFKGMLEDEEVEIEVVRHMNTHVEILGPPGFAEVEGQLKDMFSQMVPKGREKKRLSVKEAREVLLEESLERLIEPEEVRKIAIERAEESGIVFIDEIDKISGGGSQSKGPDVSREGVQRDLLPLVEGSVVSTKYGHVKTDHMLFIASGAFHFSKPSDLMPEFQGRFPIRVELESLTAEHFYRILNEPDNALPKQYQALLKTEEVELVFKEDGLKEIARVAAVVNERIENIGARRLHTLLERILEEVSFTADANRGSTITIDKQYVEKMLEPLVHDDDITRFIL